MTQVSKRYLSQDVQKRMYAILVKAVGKASDKEDTIRFLTDLLSPIERIMLAKRLAIAYLLLKGNYTTREISNILKVSLTTIQKVSLVLNIQGEGYKRIIKSLTQEEKVEAFMDRVAEVLTSVPPKGKDWKTWRRDREREKAKRRKAF